MFSTDILLPPTGLPHAPPRQDFLPCSSPGPFPYINFHLPAVSQIFPTSPFPASPPHSPFRGFLRCPYRLLCNPPHCFFSPPFIFHVPPVSIPPCPALVPQPLRHFPFPSPPFHSLLCPSSLPPVHRPIIVSSPVSFISPFSPPLLQLSAADRLHDSFALE